MEEVRMELVIGVIRLKMRLYVLLTAPVGMVYVTEARHLYLVLLTAPVGMENAHTVKKEAVLPIVQLR
jgi:hypothetical protein